MTNIPLVKDFFSNKVNIQIKSGQRFEGLLSKVDYKNKIVILEEVEDLGNEHDKHFIPHDMKIAEKAFELENINEIFFKEKHFSEPKKYKKEQFWDATSEPQTQPKKTYKQKYEKSQRSQRPNNDNYKEKRFYDNNRDNNSNYRKYDNRNGGYRNNRRQEQPRQYIKEQRQERDLR